MYRSDWHDTMARSGRSQRGFSLITAIFILVILAALGAAMVTFSASQHHTLALDVLSARAHQAARAGVQWGAYQAIKGPVGAFSCPSTTNLTLGGAGFAGFTVSVQCSTSTHIEDAATVNFYEFIATASYGTVGGVDYVSRQVRAVIVK